MHSKPKLEITVSIKSPRKSFYEGTCFSVSSTNDKGNFDILPQHANFVTVVKKEIVVRKTPKEAKKIVIGSGILVAKENVVNVFLD
ncbi:hypothetical protein KJ605_00365 [Patescibacteria group bacterium]|nr:hypothetical protein [Patescibacteria group bacterium]MBU1970222.1 hypothetical protein [Patescibacteria group bacterium]